MEYYQMDVNNYIKSKDIHSLYQSVCLLTFLNFKGFSNILANSCP